MVIFYDKILYDLLFYILNTIHNSHTHVCYLANFFENIHFYYMTYILYYNHDQMIHNNNNIDINHILYLRNNYIFLNGVVGESAGLSQDIQ